MSNRKFKLLALLRVKAHEIYLVISSSMSFSGVIWPQFVLRIRRL